MKKASARRLSTPRTLIRIQPLYNEMQAAYQEVESTLSASAGMSSRAAAHLRDITRLTAATSTLMRRDRVGPARRRSTARRGEPPIPTSSRSRRVLLANDIVALIENVKSFQTSKLGMERGERRICRSSSPWFRAFKKHCRRTRSTNEIEASLHAVSRRLWRAEARIVKLGWPTDLERQWRDVRERLNVISDELGLPRVIDLATRAGPDQPPAPRSSAKPTTRIYRGPR